MAETPCAAAWPACPSRPCTSSRTRITPRRPVFRLPSVCGGSSPTTPAAPAAAAMTALRPSGLDTSSSATRTTRAG